VPGDGTIDSALQLERRNEFRLLDIDEATDRRVIERDADEALRPHTVVVVEDSPQVLQVIHMSLRRQFKVLTAPDGLRGLDMVIREQPSLVVTDLMMPEIDGLELTSRLRADPRTRHIPVLMLTARAALDDRVKGLETGVSAYLTKPFSPRELLARIRALLRRSRAHETVADGLARIRAYRFEGWELSVRLRRLTTPRGETVALTNSEFNLLAAFLAAPQRVLSRDQLLNLSRLHNDEVYDRSIDVQVGRLRKKLEPDASQPRLIRTERGAGYVFTASVEVVR
jgi:DNA-binding response OmpR family regulator